MQRKLFHYQADDDIDNICNARVIRCVIYVIGLATCTIALELMAPIQRALTHTTCRATVDYIYQGGRLPDL